MMKQLLLLRSAPCPLPTYSPPPHILLFDSKHHNKLAGTPLWSSKRGGGLNLFLFELFQHFTRSPVLCWPFCAREQIEEACVSWFSWKAVIFLKKSFKIYSMKAVVKSWKRFSPLKDNLKKETEIESWLVSAPCLSLRPRKLEEIKSTWVKLMVHRLESWAASTQQVFIKSTYSHCFGKPTSAF